MLTLFFSGIILLGLLLIIHSIPYAMVPILLIEFMIGGYLFIWYIAAKPWGAQKGT